MLPRAFMAKPIAQDSRGTMPASRAPSAAPPIFPTQAISMTIVHRTRSKLAAKSMLTPIPAKKSGAKKLDTNSRIVVRVRSRKCDESPSATPVRNAPKIACRPAFSVSAPPNRASAMAKTSTPLGHDVCAWTHGNTRWIAQRPRVRMKMVNATIDTTTPINASGEPCAPTIPRMTANTIHPTRSLKIADAITTIPKSER